MNIVISFSIIAQQSAESLLSKTDVEKEFHHLVDEAQDHFKKMQIIKDRIEKQTVKLLENKDKYGNIFMKSNYVYSTDIWMDITENMNAVSQIMIDGRKMQKHMKAIHHLIKKAIKANQDKKDLKIEQKINDLFKKLVENSVIKLKEIEEITLKVQREFDSHIVRYSGYPDLVNSVRDMICNDKTREAVAKAYIKLYTGSKKVPGILKSAAGYKDEAVKEMERVHTFIQKKALYEAHAAADRARAAKAKAVERCFEVIQLLHPSTSMPLVDEDVQAFKANKAIAEAVKIANAAKKAADAVEECISKLPQEREEKLIARWVGLDHLQSAHKKEELFQSFNVIKRMKVDSCVSDSFKQMFSAGDPALKVQPSPLVGNPCSGPTLDELG